jgi:archaeosine synthase
MKKTIILNSGKCSWGRCIFCGWGKHDFEINTEALINTFDASVDPGVTSLKIFGSGSFLDYKQFPKEFQEHVAKVMKGKELVIESRPEYVTKESLSVFKGVKLVVAMGLEAADNKVLKKLRKGVTLTSFKKACKLLHDHGFKAKGYILVNPPFDYKGLLNKSVKFGLENCEELVLINTYPHAKAELFNYWIKGKWSPINEEEFKERVKKYKSRKISLDFDNYSFEPRFEKQERLIGVDKKYISHPYFNVWQDYFTRFYKKPEDKDIALFLPCSKKKPYYNSRTHRAIRRVIAGYDWYKRVHIIVISNPGVIPIEFSGKYPFTAYDWNERKETPAIMKEYIKVNTERVKNYLRGYEYKKVFSYFKPESESGLCLENACKELRIKLVKLVDKKVYEKLKDKRNPIIHPLMLRAFKENISKAFK